MTRIKQTFINKSPGFSVKRWLSSGGGKPRFCICSGIIDWKRPTASVNPEILVFINLYRSTFCLSFSVCLSPSPVCVCVCVSVSVCVHVCALWRGGDRSPNAAGWRKVNRKQKVPMEEVYDICQDPGWVEDSAPPLRRPRVTHRTAVAEVVTTPWHFLGNGGREPDSLGRSRHTHIFE